MKVLVTGPDGVLGGNVVRELIQRGYQVTAMSENGKPSPTIDDLPINKIGGNLLNVAEIDFAVSQADVVIHCAASTSMYPPRSEQVYDVNVKGTENIVEACIKHKIRRLIYIGTANSFAAGSKQSPGNEANHYSGQKYGLDYMDSKYQAQCLVKDAVKNKGLDAVIINPTYMIGPYDARPSSGAMILSVYFQKLPGYTLGGKNFVAVKDVAVAVVNAIEKGKKGECYIAGNENLTYQEALFKIAAVVGVRPPKRRLSSWVVRTFGKANSIFARILRYRPDITHELAILASEEHYYSSQKAQAELEMPQTPIEVAIKECFEWFKANGYTNK